MIQSLRIYTGENIIKKEARSDMQGRKNVQGIKYKRGRNYVRKIHWTFPLWYSTLPFVRIFLTNKLREMR